MWIVWMKKEKTHNQMPHQKPQISVCVCEAENAVNYLGRIAHTSVFRSLAALPCVTSSSAQSHRLSLALALFPVLSDFFLVCVRFVFLDNKVTAAICNAETVTVRAVVYEIAVIVSDKEYISNFLRFNSCSLPEIIDQFFPMQWPVFI